MLAYFKANLRLYNDMNAYLIENILFLQHHHLVIFFKKKNYFLLSFQLCRVCMWTFSGCGKAGAALLCSAQTYRGGLSFCGTWALGAQASVVVVPGLSCSETCGTFPDQESNLCLCIGRQILSHRTTREVHLAIFYH